MGTETILGITLVIMFIGLISLPVIGITWKNGVKKVIVLVIVGTFSMGLPLFTYVNIFGYRGELCYETTFTESTEVIKAIDGIETKWINRKAYPIHTILFFTPNKKCGMSLNMDDVVIHEMDTLKKAYFREEYKLYDSESPIRFEPTLTKTHLYCPPNFIN